MKNVGGVMVLVLCSSSNDTLYLYKVSLNYLKRVSELFRDYFFHIQDFQRGIIQLKIYGELWSLFSAYLLMTLYICTKFHENI